MAFTLPSVPTGIKIGVGIFPCAVDIWPVLADVWSSFFKMVNSNKGRIIIWLYLIPMAIKF